MTDAYHGNAFQVFFDEEERIEFIELSRNDGIGAIFQGTDLLHTPAEQVILLLCSVANLDSNHSELGNTYTFPELELSLWRAVIPQGDGDSEGRFFNTVGIGKLGYFSR
ncbi:hypothetical protein [Deinococcus planocerae]|uniref:hypothetical protein n=1 Tax=Deinococcus planocerae TaxID=1737569 RepID=UPI0011AF2B80|nr:hypothetical protein [Deinococcus planocerae]